MSRNWMGRACAALGLMALVYCILAEVDGIGRFALIVAGVGLGVTGMFLPGNGRKDR